MAACFFSVHFKEEFSLSAAWLSLCSGLQHQLNIVISELATIFNAIFSSPATEEYVLVLTAQKKKIFRTLCIILKMFRFWTYNASYHPSKTTIQMPCSWLSFRHQSLSGICKLPLLLPFWFRQRVIKTGGFNSQSQYNTSGRSNKLLYEAI